MINPIKLIRNLIKIAKLVSVDDSGDLQFATVSTLGKQQKILMLKPYGLMSNPPAGSIVTVLSQQGHESNGIGIADDPANRTLKDLEEGEVGLGNYSTGSYIFFDKDKKALLSAEDSVLITADNDITIFAFDDITMYATDVCTINGSVIRLNGSSYHLTMYEQLKAQLDSLVAEYNTHWHDGTSSTKVPEVQQTLTLIAGAKATTLLTDG